MVDVEELEMVEVDPVVAVSAVDAVPEAMQLLDDDVVRVEVEPPEVARCPPQPKALAVVDLE